MHGHGISCISSIGIDNGMLIIITIGSAAEITLGSVNDTLSRDDAILDHSGLYILGEIQANGNATEFCGYGKVNTDVFSARELNDSEVFGRIIFMMVRNLTVQSRVTLRIDPGVLTKECISRNIQVLESDLVLVFIQDFCILNNAGLYACPLQVNFRSIGDSVMYYNDSDIFNISNITSPAVPISRVEDEILQNPLRQPIVITDTYLNAEVLFSSEGMYVQ